MKIILTSKFKTKLMCVTNYASVKLDIAFLNFGELKTSITEKIKTRPGI